MNKDTKVCDYCGKNIRGKAIRYRYRNNNNNFYYNLHKKCKNIVKKKAKNEETSMSTIIDEDCV